MNRRLLTAAALVLGAAATVTACSSDAPRSATTTAAIAPVARANATAGAGANAVAAPAGTSTAAVRWWSNSAAGAGSTVDVAHPSAVAAKLQPSRVEYCSMLKQTLAAGHSVLSGVPASDPRFAATTTAFVSELERVAPSEVAASWQVLGGVIVSLVSGQAGTHPAASTISSAVATVSADAKTRCGISLSRAG